MNDYNVNGMVISVMPIGEYDRRLELLTAELGRISVFARGSRRPGSALSGVCRLFALGTFRLFRGKNSYTLASASISSYFTEMADDMERSFYGSYFLELCRYFSRENAEAGEMLRLISVSLKALISPSFDNRLVRAVFELKILQINGICPQAEKITSSQGRFAAPVPLSPSAEYTVSFVLNSPISKLYSFRLTDEVLDEFAETSSRLMKILVGGEFKSLALLETTAGL